MLCVACQFVQGNTREWFSVFVAFGSFVFIVFYSARFVLGVRQRVKPIKINSGAP